MGRYDEIDPDGAYEAWCAARAEEAYEEREPPFDPEEEALEEYRERRLEEHARFSAVAGEDLEEVS